MKGHFTEDVCCPNCGANLELDERLDVCELDPSDDEPQSVVCTCGADLTLYRIWSVKENG